MLSASVEFVAKVEKCQGVSAERRSREERSVHTVFITACS